MELKKIIPFFALVFSLSLFAAKSSPTKVRKNLLEEKAKLSSITKNIAAVESQLESINNKVLKLGSSKRNLEESIFKLKKDLLSSMANLNGGKKEIKSLLTSIAVNTIQEEEGPAFLLSKKILISTLKKKLLAYNGQITATEKQQQRLSQVEQDLKLYETKEKMLLDTIADLEESKKQEAEKYIQTKNDYQKTLRAWEEVKVSRTKNKEGLGLREKLGVFQPPLESHTSLDFKKKGVTFLFRERQPVRSPRAGKVIHKGELSTYGKVVMIDHGNETISICLGDFSPQVQKGTSVNQGDILGYTKVKTRGNPSKLYFEVRQKDKAQATIHLLDEKALASAGSLRRKS
ncbi:MAG: peptidoglycan DD-metalloendopeptidase family protein [Bacteriovoracaceae bacterium]|nr:peptidoglycan DD-metalloendopeptidase family protein [Bacteriovoracaceae bacterium]